jgi:ABC-type transport system substrate-binding protein
MSMSYPPQHNEDTDGELPHASRKRRWPWMAAVLLVVVAATVAVTLALTRGTNTSAPASDTEETSVAETPPEDLYINSLAASGLFPSNAAGDARDVWIRTGRAACDLLESNGDITATRFEIYTTIIEYSRQGSADPDLAERAVTIVDGASRYLCPDVPAS